MSQIKMPPKIVRRGRPKGAEATVIGLPRKRGHDGKLKKRPKLFINKSAREKEACKYKYVTLSIMPGDSTIDRKMPIISKDCNGL